MSGEKDILIKISYVESSELLEEFLEGVKEIGLMPSEVRQRMLPSKPDRVAGNSTKDVMITVSGDPGNTDQIIAEFLIRVENELGLLPASKHEKLLGESN
ncbi:hypothetical protein R4J70_18825 [Pseudomonas aeruginosa]|uniref:hypothetical protein n=1 Tax=Pseudomonas TaxID=286 RepID=UPI0010672D53|nr:MULTISPECIES: hypothetical protein [Pseudomonas]MBH3538941.1 hypothetical protein [Pseudomonas aeruginosa]MCV0238885.1 hypothetical protein [Pseudomonas aeruginosa]MDE9759667.1 hypothetical protein [Pseudomonas aeruginosa]MDU0791239.1 hypothetical protein [Pseudomonas aeruginosa]MDV7782038.1 hypothetical protein [Pseudomonas aeruginosa]